MIGNQLGVHFNKIIFLAEGRVRQFHLKHKVRHTCKHDNDKTS